MFKAKPARNVVRVRPLRGSKTWSEVHEGGTRRGRRHPRVHPGERGEPHDEALTGHLPLSDHDDGHSPLYCVRYGGSATTSNANGADQSHHPRGRAASARVVSLYARWSELDAKQR